MPTPPLAPRIKYPLARDEPPPGEQHPMRGCVGDGETRGGHHVDVVRQSEELVGPDLHVLGQRTPGRVADHARGADQRVHEDPVTFGPTLHAGAHGRHGARGVATRDHRQRRGDARYPATGEQVVVVQRRGLHPHEDLALARLGRRHLVDPQDLRSPVLVEDQRLHRLATSIAPISLATSARSDGRSARSTCASTPSRVSASRSACSSGWPSTKLRRTHRGAVAPSDGGTPSRQRITNGSVSPNGCPTRSIVSHASRSPLERNPLPRVGRGRLEAVGPESGSQSVERFVGADRPPPERSVLRDGRRPVRRLALRRIGAEHLEGAAALQREDPVTGPCARVGAPVVGVDAQRGGDLVAHAVDLTEHDQVVERERGHRDRGA